MIAAISFVSLRALRGSRTPSVSSVPSVVEKLSVKALHHHRYPLPAADACRREPVLFLSTAQLIQKRDHQPRAGRAQRMSQRDRSAVHVHLVAIQTQFFLDRQILRRKRFVDFDQIDVVERQPRPL